MQFISSELGFILVFNNADDLAGRVEHLQGFLEFIRAEDVKPPHLYAVFDDRIPADEIKDMLEYTKMRLSSIKENDGMKALEFELVKMRNLTRELLNDIYEFGEPKGEKTIQALHDLVFKDIDT